MRRFGKLRPSSLRWRIDILRATSSINEYGQAIQTWTAFAQNVPAALLEVQDAERWRAGSVEAMVDIRLRIYAGFDVTTRDRIFFEQETYAISRTKLLNIDRDQEISARFLD